MASSSSSSVVEKAADEETIPLRLLFEQKFELQLQAKQIAAMQAQIHSLTTAASISKPPKIDDTARNASKAIIEEQSGGGGIITNTSNDNGKNAEPRDGDEEEAVIYKPEKKEPLSTWTSTATTTNLDGSTSGNGGSSSEEQQAAEDEDAVPASTEQPAAASSPGSFWTAHILSSKLGTKNNIALPQTIYSMLYIANCESLAFLYAFSVFVLQAGMIVLVLMDQINIDTVDGNPFSIPAGVPPQVTAAQATCLFVAVALQDDFIQSVNNFNAGCDPEFLTKKADFEAASKGKFRISVILQLLVGLAQLVATFALVMSSETVIDVFLNFAGLSFVSMVDDAGFLVAAHGYLPRSIQRVCQQTQAVKRQTPRNFWLPQFLSLLAIAGLMTGFGITLNQQLNGKFLCQKLYVQFGDKTRLEYGAFSGEYVIQPAKRLGDRVSYLEVESMQSKSGRSMIAYCSELEAWTHSSWNLTNKEVPDPCARWKARLAGKTAAYDVRETSNAPWVIISDTTGVPGPLDWLYMVCNDCNDATCNPEHGYCSDNDCVCHSGRMGLNCVFEGPCERIVRDANTFHFAEDFTGVAFSLFKDSGNEMVLYRKHPVYFLIPEDMGLPFFIMFMGRRWAQLALISYRQGMDFASLAADFHPAYDFPYVVVGSSDLSANFVRLSEPVDVSMSSYRVDPVGLSWERVDAPFFRFTSTLDLRLHEEFKFLCGVCQAETNPCVQGHMYACSWNGVCQCETGYVGALCEASISCDVEGFACQNGGICSSVGTCDCESSGRYWGAFCERDNAFYHYEYAPAVQGLHNRTSECGCATTLQLEYRGTTNQVNGTPCLQWTEVGSALARYRIPLPEDAPELGMVYNYCRNPLMAPSRAYCYTNETNSESCSVPYCPAEICPNMNETCGCIEKWHLDEEDGFYKPTPYGQQNYRGFLNVTKGGKACLRWDSHPYHVTPESHPDAGLDENYCRNPTPGDDMNGVWCYTDDPDDFYQPCDVPSCPLYTCYEPAFTLYNTYDAAWLNLHLP